MPNIWAGRFQDIPIEYRPCFMFSNNQCESEAHFTRLRTTVNTEAI